MKGYLNVWRDVTLDLHQLTRCVPSRRPDIFRSGQHCVVAAVHPETIDFTGGLHSSSRELCKGLTHAQCLRIRFAFLCFKQIGHPYHMIKEKQLQCYEYLTFLKTLSA